MAHQQVNLRELAKAGGGTRRGQEEKEAPRTEVIEAPQSKPAAHERCAITFTQQPPAVRQQLNMLKVETGKTLENLGAEAINDLFAKYGKPEIAVIKKKGREA
jgi:hypothetical protein